MAVRKIKENTQKRSLREASEGQDYTIWTMTMDVAVPKGGKITGVSADTGPDSLYNEISDVLIKHGYEMAGDFIDIEEDAGGITQMYQDNDYEFFTESLEEDDDILRDRHLTLDQINKELNSIDTRHNDVTLTDEEFDDMYQAGYTLGTSNSGIYARAARKDYVQYKSGKDVNGNPIKRNKNGRVVKVRKESLIESWNDTVVRGHVTTWNIHETDDSKYLVTPGNKTYPTLEKAKKAIRIAEDNYVKANPKCKVANKEIWADHGTLWVDDIDGGYYKGEETL